MEAKRHPEIITKTLTSKTVVYDIAIPAYAVAFTLKTRGNHELRVAFNNGDIGSGKYITIPAGTSLSEDFLHKEGILKVYVQCAEVDSEVLECLYWR